jgi:hypothetical protein
MKSRGVYETPGGTILLAAHRGIESITLDRGAAHLKDELMPKYAELIYNGFWFSPEREMLQALIDKSQEHVEGTRAAEALQGQCHRGRPRSPEVALFRMRSSPSRTTAAPTTRRTPPASSSSTPCACARSVVGAPSNGLVPDTVAAVTLASGASPVFIAIAEAKAIAQRDPGFESTEVVRGAFGGASPKPAEEFDTLGVTTRLVARASLRDSLVGDATRAILAARPAVAAIVPAANRIEAPSTDKGEALPTHPGAAAFLDGEEETFFEKYSDFFYIGAMLLSVVGSAVAALLSRLNTQNHMRVETLLARLMEIHRAVRAARDPAIVDGLEQEADDILAATLESHQVKALDGHNVSALSLALHQVRLAIEDQRRAVRAAPPAE